MVIMVGTLTQLRLDNAAIEDLAHVIGVNRSRTFITLVNAGLTGVFAGLVAAAGAATARLAAADEA